MPRLPTAYPKFSENSGLQVGIWPPVLAARELNRRAINVDAHGRPESLAIEPGHEARGATDIEVAEPPERSEAVLEDRQDLHRLLTASNLVIHRVWMHLGEAVLVFRAALSHGRPAAASRTDWQDSRAPPKTPTHTAGVVTPECRRDLPAASPRGRMKVPGFLFPLSLEGSWVEMAGAESRRCPL